MATGNRKHGRNKASCKRYRDEGRQEKSKARRIAKHEKMYPKKSKLSAAMRRAVGVAWKQKAASLGRHIVTT